MLNPRIPRAVAEALKVRETTKGWVKSMSGSLLLWRSMGFSAMV